MPILTRLTLFFSCFFVAVIAHAQIPTNGLIAHWPFTGNTNDAHGTHHGNPSNITSTQGKMGTNGTAYLFNSPSSYIGIPYQSDMNVPVISMCAVFKADAFYTGTCQGNYIISRGLQGSSGSLVLLYFDNAYNDCSVTDTNSFVFSGHVGTIISQGSLAQSATRVRTNTWYCFIMTFDGISTKFYVNGILVNTITGWSPTIGSSTDSICIGKYPWGGPSFPYNFIGVIDDVAIYNRPLSVAEIDSYCTNAPKIGGPIDTEATVSISQPLTKVTFCPGDDFLLHYTVTAPFNPGNIFTAQLSDAVGGFANPVNIGSVTATGAGTINCTIPANTPPGTGYRVRVAASDPLNTSVDNGVNLTVSEFPQIIVDNRNIVTCVDDTLNLSVQVSPPGTAITWFGPMGFNYTGNNATIPKITPGHTGNYIITANNNGCVTSDSINITIGDPYFILGNDTTLCESKTLELQALSLPGSAYLWQDGSTGPTFTVREKGLYYVRATNICGSFGSNIQVDYIPCECNPVMPTAFTPNNDGLNDAIGPILDCIPAVYKFIIANQWGNIVFETDDYQKKWDGRHVSVPAQLGTYFYYIQITDKLGNKTMRKGDITLIR